MTKWQMMVSTETMRYRIERGALKATVVILVQLDLVMECGGLEVVRKKVMSNYYYILSILKKKKKKNAFGVSSTLKCLIWTQVICKVIKRKIYWRGGGKAQGKKNGGLVEIEKEQGVEEMRRRDRGIYSENREGQHRKL